MTYDLVVQDKKPLALFASEKKKGFCRFLEHFQERHKVAQIADECETKSRDAVILSLKRHFSRTVPTPFPGHRNAPFRIKGGTEADH